MTCQAQWAVAARVVLPVDHDEDVLPLYVEYGRRYAGIDDRHDKRIRGWGEYKGTEAPAIGNAEGHSDDVLSRSSMAIRPGVRVSFATYVNAFPASYWRRWTTVDQVRLRVEVDGDATVLVYRSNARGASIKLHSFPTGAAAGRSSARQRSSRSTSTWFPSSTAAGTGSTSWAGGSARSSRRRSGRCTAYRNARRGCPSA